jgi:3D (Asp-Asp-Asp) domain-containing protein
MSKWTIIIAALIYVTPGMATGPVMEKLKTMNMASSTPKLTGPGAMEALEQFANEMKAEKPAPPRTEAKKEAPKTKVSFDNSRRHCSPTVARSTVYFIPHIKDYCSGSRICSAFKKEVKMQGSGIIGNNKVLTYTGAKKNVGNCDTSFGAAGKCLTPYISVAADDRHFNMGDIIKMPAMKGLEVRLPNGKRMKHPGYFIVQDTGGAINGVNRFDFFTGTLDSHDPRNTFGTEVNNGSRMSVKSDCSDHKKFTVIRRKNSEAYIAAYNELRPFLKGEMPLTPRVASADRNRGRGTN